MGGPIILVSPLSSNQFPQYQFYLVEIFVSQIQFCGAPANSLEFFHHVNNFKYFKWTIDSPTQTCLCVDFVYLVSIKTITVPANYLRALLSIASAPLRALTSRPYFFSYLAIGRIEICISKINLTSYQKTQSRLRSLSIIAHFHHAQQKTQEVEIWEEIFQNPLPRMHSWSLLRCGTAIEPYEKRSCMQKENCFMSML